MRIPALIGLALASPLMACSRPSDVCVADETMATARSLLLDYLIGDPRGVDTDLVQRAYDDVVTFELIRFDGQDKSTKTIRCRATVKSTNSRGLAEIVYVRQPNLGATGYVYSITLEPDSAVAWMPIVRDIVSRTERLEDMTIDYSPHATEPATAPLPDDNFIPLPTPQVPIEPATAPAAKATDQIAEVSVDSRSGSASPPPVTIPREDTRTEYRGPAVIVPGPPPPPPATHP